MVKCDISYIPLEPAPPGQESNLINPPSHAWIPRVTVYITLPLAVGFILLRLVTRSRLPQRLQQEDYLCIAAGVAGIGLCSVLLKTVHNDIYGRHTWDIPLVAMNPTFFQETFAIPLLHSVAAVLTKLSLLALFYRLFSPSPRSRILIGIGIIFTIVSYTAVVIAWIYFSVPHIGEKGWLDPIFVERIAYAGAKIAVVLGALSSFTDLYVITIPLISIVGLNLSIVGRVGLTAVFATGFVACSVSIASLVSRLAIYRTSQTKDGIYDFHWASMQAYALSVVEINLGIVCACVPITCPLFMAFAHRLSFVGSYFKKKVKTSETRGVLPINIKQLPQLPTGSLVTLRSIFRNPQNFHHDKSQSRSVTRFTNIDMTPHEKI